MANRFYKLALGGIFAIIIIGGYMAFTGYANDVYPLDQSVGFLHRIVATSDPQSIILILIQLKQTYLKQVILFGSFQQTLLIFQEYKLILIQC